MIKEPCLRAFMVRLQYWISHHIIMMVIKLQNRLLVDWWLMKMLGKKLPREQLGKISLEKIMEIIYLRLMKEKRREGIVSVASKIVSPSLWISKRIFGLFGSDSGRFYHPTRIASKDKFDITSAMIHLSNLKRVFLRPIYKWFEYENNELCGYLNFLQSFWSEIKLLTK